MQTQLLAKCLGTLLADHGDDALSAIWGEVTRWAAEPRRLHRNYTVDHFAELLAHRPPVLDRTA